VKPVYWLLALQPGGGVSNASCFCPFSEFFVTLKQKYCGMEAVVIEVKNDADVKFWLNLAKKTGTKAKSINTEEIEDSRLAEIIEKGMKTKTVSRESVMEILQQK
jgi:hypothetical protein